MTLQYKIILVSDLTGNLSEVGESLLLVSRYNNYRTKTIHCINHSQERISTMFKVGFDVESFLSNTKTYSHEEALSEMQTEEWRYSEDKG